MQFSLFGAAAVEPSLVDVDGVLLAGGHWVRSGELARLSVVVADRWRADALTDAFEVLRIAEPVDPIGDAEGGFAVRSAFDQRLAAHAARWTRGANQGPPTPFTLSPGGLRLWAIAAGHSDQAGFTLGTSEPDDAVHLAAGSALARIGLVAVSLTGRAGPGWRITSVKRLRRLAELLGERPAGAGSDWPS